MYLYGPTNKACCCITFYNQICQKNCKNESFRSLTSSKKNRQFSKLLKGSEVKGLFVCIINHLL